MVNISKSGNAIKFTFTDSDHYLYGNGEVEVPVNSLSLVIDESDFVVFKKASTNDTFITFNPADSNLSDKAGVIEFYKDNMVGSTGGGSASGVTPSEVQEMIDESISDVWDTIDEKEEVIASALTDVRQDVADIDAKEEVIASALTEVRQNVADKQDALQYYSENTEDGTAMINVEGEYPLLSLSTFATDGASDLIELDNRVFLNDVKDDGSGNTSDASIIIDNGEVSFDVARDENGETNHTYMLVNPSGVTINGENVLTEADGVYYVNFTTLTTQGIHDADWDGLVNAINAHRPIYAGLGDLYYTAECLYQDGGNRIIMTASDHNSHYFYTFTKNDSENYSFSYTTKPYVTDAEKTAWNAKQDALSAGTGIEISGNVISATGGGGATYSAGYGINIDTANTISFNMPITCTTNTNDNITIGNGANNGSWSLLVGNDMSITNSSAAIGLCTNDMSVGGSSISGNSRGVLIGCANSIKGGNADIGGGVAIGNRNESTNGGIVIGTNSKASGSSTVAIGLSANATGTTKMNLNNQIKVDTNNQVYIKDKTNTTDVCIQDAIAALGGLKFVQCTQAEYDALVSGGTVDSSTIYFITNVVS